MAEAGLQQARSLAEGRAGEAGVLAQQACELRRQLAEATSKWQEGEVLRRRLHNTIMVQHTFRFSSTFKAHADLLEHAGCNLSCMPCMSLVQYSRERHELHRQQDEPVVLHEAACSHFLSIMQFRRLERYVQWVGARRGTSAGIEQQFLEHHSSHQAGQRFVISPSGELMLSNHDEKAQQSCICDASNKDSLSTLVHMQELKGNIRVFCRVRPLLESDAGAGPTSLQYPNSGGSLCPSSVCFLAMQANMFSKQSIFSRLAPMPCKLQLRSLCHRM